MKAFVILLAIVIGAARPVFIFKEFNKHVSQSYQAAAHALVGALFGAWWFTSAAWMIWIVGILSAVEVVCAATSIVRKRKHG